MKKGSSLATSTVVLLVIAIVILVVLILGFTYGWDKLGLSFMGEEEFRIKENICHNESIRENYDFPRDFEEIECPYEKIKVPCYDNEGNLILKLKCVEKKRLITERESDFCWTIPKNNNTIYTQNCYSNGYCASFLSEYYYGNESSKWILIQTQFEDEIMKGKINKTICEEIEVDEEYIENLPIDEDIIINLVFLTYFDIGNKENWFSEWLDENCDAARCTPCEDLECKNQKCDLYSYGDYTIEVSK